LYLVCKIIATTTKATATKKAPIPIHSIGSWPEKARLLAKSNAKYVTSTLNTRHIPERIRATSRLFILSIIALLRKNRRRRCFERLGWAP
jgi:hypothetical protein